LEVLKRAASLLVWSFVVARRHPVTGSSSFVSNQLLHAQRWIRLLQAFSKRNEICSWQAQGYQVPGMVASFPNGNPC
jgi:hypothetical protein